MRPPARLRGRPRFRCLLCPGQPWFDAYGEPFAAWQAHYVVNHLKRPEA